MAKILTVGGKQKELTDLSLPSLQKAVGGYIELVKTLNKKRMLVNEDGKPLGLVYNEQASLLFGDPIFGDVVLLDKKDKI